MSEHAYHIEAWAMEKMLRMIWNKPYCEWKEWWLRTRLLPTDSCHQHWSITQLQKKKKNEWQSAVLKHSFTGPIRSQKMPLYITMLILSCPQTIWGRSPDNQVELSEWATACFKHWIRPFLPEVSVIWNYLSIPKLQQLHRCSLGVDE